MSGSGAESSDSGEDDMDPDDDAENVAVLILWMVVMNQSSE